MKNLLLFIWWFLAHQSPLFLCASNRDDNLQDHIVRLVNSDESVLESRNYPIQYEEKKEPCNCQSMVSPQFFGWFSNYLNSKKTMDSEIKPKKKFRRPARTQTTTSATSDEIIRDTISKFRYAEFKSKLNQAKPRIFPISGVMTPTEETPRFSWPITVEKRPTVPKITKETEEKTYYIIPAWKWPGKFKTKQTQKKTHLLGDTRIQKPTSSEDSRSFQIQWIPGIWPAIIPKRKPSPKRPRRPSNKPKLADEIKLFTIRWPTKTPIRITRPTPRPRGSEEISDYFKTTHKAMYSTPHSENRPLVVTETAPEMRPWHSDISNPETPSASNNKPEWDLYETGKTTKAPMNDDSDSKEDPEDDIMTRSNQFLIN